MSSVVFKSVDREGVREAVVSYADQLRREHPEIERVIWFGSWVTGLPSPGSDVDLCLIITSSEKPRRERISDYLPLGFPVGVDLLVFSRDELEQLKLSSPGMFEAITSGMEM